MLLDSFIAEVRTEMEKISTILELPVGEIQTHTVLPGEIEKIEASEHFRALFGERCLYIIGQFRSDLRSLLEEYVLVLREAGLRIGSNSGEFLAASESYNWAPHRALLQNPLWMEIREIFQRMRSAFANEFENNVFSNTLEQTLSFKNLFQMRGESS